MDITYSSLSHIGGVKARTHCSYDSVGSGHILLPVISFIALLTLDWRIAWTSLVTVPLSLVFMTLTMIISGKSFTQYDESNVYMNSASVEYIEGIEVIKAFGRVGTSYEKLVRGILE